MVAMNKNRDLQKEADNDSQTSLSPKSIHSHDREFCNRPLRVSVQNQHYNQESSRSCGAPIPIIYDKSVEQTQREREMRSVASDGKHQRTNRHRQQQRENRHTHTQPNESDSFKHTHTQQNESDSERDSERQRSRSRSNERTQSVIVRPVPKRASVIVQNA